MEGNKTIITPEYTNEKELEGLRRDLELVFKTGELEYAQAIFDRVTRLNSSRNEFTPEERDAIVDTYGKGAFKEIVSGDYLVKLGYCISDVIEYWEENPEISEEGKQKYTTKKVAEFLRLLEEKKLGQMKENLEGMLLESSLQLMTLLQEIKGGSE